MNSMSCTEARMVTARSSTTCTSIAGGSDARSCGNRFLTRSMVSRMFAPGCRRTMIKIARSPSAHPASLLFSTLSVTLAMSPKWIDAPF